MGDEEPEDPEEGKRRMTRKKQRKKRMLQRPKRRKPPKQFTKNCKHLMEFVSTYAFCTDIQDYTYSIYVLRIYLRLWLRLVSRVRYVVHKGWSVITENEKSHPLSSNFVHPCKWSHDQTDEAIYEVRPQATTYFRYNKLLYFL